MAASGEPLEPLKYQVWILKVSIHCEGCKRKVNRVLKRIEGVYTITIESRQHKVIVTGNVEAEILIQKLMESGKRAELWPEDKNQDNEDDSNENAEKQSKDSIEVPVQGDEHETATKVDEEEANPPTNQGSGKKKKKKKKKKVCHQDDTNGKDNNNNSVTSPPATGVVTIELTPSRAPVYQNFTPFTYPTTYAVSLNSIMPSIVYDVSYYESPSDMVSDDGYYPPSTESYDLFSDENPYGCTVM